MTGDLYNAGQRFVIYYSSKVSILSNKIYSKDSGQQTVGRWQKAGGRRQ
jgi:hypothetical protein